ncbi:hypothetical protein [Paenirhodobacter sp.]
MTLAGGGLIVTACLFLGVWLTLGSLAALSAGSAFGAAQLARSAAARQG